MQIGKLRNYCEILAPGTPKKNDYGEETATYSHFEYRWAAVEPLVGNELLKAQQITSNPQYRVRMRYVPNLLNTHKLKLPTGTLLDIVSIVNVGNRNEEHELLAKDTV